jgi:hypothetical protein
VPLLEGDWLREEVEEELPVEQAEPVPVALPVPLGLLLSEMQAVWRADPDSVGLTEGLAPALRDPVGLPDREELREAELLGVTELLPEAVPVGDPVPLGVGEVVLLPLTEALSVLLTLEGGLPLGDTEALEPLER